MAGPIRISILADGARARREIGQTSNAAGKMGKAFKSAGRVAALGVAGIAAGVTAFAAVSLKSVARIERIGKQTDAVIESTGGVANVTRAQIDELAGSLEAMTATEAESITEGANMLLTFTNLRNETGRGNDIFNQTVSVLTDMSRAMDNTGGVVLDTRKEAVRLGKALNDPVKGVSALAKVGVTFTAQQKKTIESLVESGDVMGAQKLILRELTKEFGGSGEAFAKTTTGKIELAKHEIGTLGETIVGSLLPALGDLATNGTEGLRWATDFAKSNIAPKVGELVDYVRANKDEVIDFASAVGDRVLPVLDELGELAVDTGERFYKITRPIAEDLLPALGDLADIGGAVVGFFNDLPGPVKDVGIQVAIAALALGPLRAGIDLATASMVRGTGAAVGYYRAIRFGAASSQSAAAGAAGLASAAKSAAGIGGILALTSSLMKAKDEGNSFSSVMLGAAGGAGIGAMFGPIGLLIGAGAGAGLSGLIGSFKQTAEEAEAARLELLRTEGFADAKNDAEGLRVALIGVADAYGKTSRAAIEAEFTKDGKLDADIKKLRDLGVSMDTIVSATLGQADAQRIVDSALSTNIGGLQQRADETKAAYDEVMASLGALDDLQRQNALYGGEGDLQIDRVNELKSAYESARSAVEEATILQENFGQKVAETSGQIADYRARLKALADDLGITVRQYKAFPKSVRTDIEDGGLPQTSRDAVQLIRDYRGLQSFDRIRAVISAPGVELTRKQIRNLAGAYKLTPRQVKTLLRVEGIDAAVKGTKRATDGLKAVGRTKPDLSGYKQNFTRSMGQLKRNADDGAKGITRSLRDGTKNAKADLSKLAPSVTQGTGPAKSAARIGGVFIGDELESGIIAGFSSAQSRLSSNAYAAVRAAIAAGKAAGRIKSPSKETEYIGKMLGDGLALGMERAKPKNKKAGRSLVATALAGIGNGSGGISTSIDRITKLIEKRINLKSDKAETKRERAVIKSLRNEFAALKRNGKAQDANNAKLERARDRYKTLVNEAKEYASAIKQGFVTYGSVVGLGTIGDGTAISADRITSQLKARLAAAQRFAQLIKSLSGKLNPTSLQQLIDAGVDGGLATAEAIAAGGASAVGQINQLTAQIAAAGGNLGAQMSDKFKQAGIDAAAGLVKGLEREQKALDRAADRIGQQIARALKKALGIKSPSKVFRGIGEQTMAGLALGLDETYARSLGSGVARGVTSGFARPTLDTRLAGSMSSASTARATAPVTVNIKVSVAAGANPVEVGRQTVKAVDAYFAAGGRTSVRWGTS